MTHGLWRSCQTCAKVPFLSKFLLSFLCPISITPLDEHLKFYASQFIHLASGIQPASNSHCSRKWTVCQLLRYPVWTSIWTVWLCWWSHMMPRMHHHLLFLLQKRAVSPISPSCCHIHHVRLFRGFCSWQWFEAWSRTSSPALDSALGSRDSCTCKHLQSSQASLALFCGSACLSECSRKTPRWTDWPQLVSGPDTSRLKSHYLLPLILAAQSQRKAQLVSFALLLMHERLRYVSFRRTRSFHLHVNSIV